MKRTTTVIALAAAAVCIGLGAAVVDRQAAAGQAPPTATATKTPSSLPADSQTPTTPTGTPAPVPTVDLCDPLPARAVSFALTEERYVIAVVAPLDTYVWETGVQLEVLAVIKGQFPPELLKDGQVHTDVRSVVSCLPFRLYRPSEVVLAAFRVSPGRATTLAGWSLVSGTGAPLARSSIPDVGDAPMAIDALNVKLGDQTTTVGELLQAGRDYIAPTATPFPPGYKTPVAPSTGGDDPRGPSGVQLPDTGIPPTTDGRSGSVALTAAGIIASALALLAAGVRVRTGVRRRG